MELNQVAAGSSLLQACQIYAPPRLVLKGGIVKDFDEYRSKVEYPDRSAIRDRITKDIDNQPMTKQERDVAYAGVARRVPEEFASAVQPYNTDSNRLQEEFWKDCRDDLGYDAWLIEKGIATLEAKAYEQGHSAGFSEVYGCLSDLSRFLDDIRVEFKGARSMPMLKGGGHARAQCRFCPRNNDHEHKGEWYWVNAECDCCSDCAHVPGRVMVPINRLVAQQSRTESAAMRATR